MRVLRELAMSVAQMTGGRFLHASACVVHGCAAIITGPRRAGKTSLLSYILANSQARFLTNDRLLIDCSNNPIRLHGMPTIVSLREGTITLFEGMRRAIVDAGYISNLTMRECHDQAPLKSFPNRTGRHGVSPAQYCSLLGCEPVNEASSAVLIFPRQTGHSGGIRLRMLDGEETQTRLENSFFGCIGPDRMSQAFSFLPTRLERKAAPNDVSLRNQLAKSFPAYECELGNEAYYDDAGAMQILDLLHSSSSDRLSGPTVASVII
jgi:hypothetical protein